MTFREATDQDQPRLVEMAARFIISTRYQEWIHTTPERIAELVRRVLEHGVIFVAEREGVLVGMLALVAVPHPLTGRDYAEEVAWWVEPEHRAGSIGPRLMHQMECWCVQNRLHMVKMVAPAGSSAGGFYEKCGYQAIETAWIKVLEG